MISFRRFSFADRRPRISQELAMAIDCCHPTPLYARLSSRARRLRWPDFLALVDRHRIAGIASRALGESDAPIPLDVRHSIRQRAKIDAAANLRALATCAGLEQEFDQAGVERLYLKGLTLSALAYGDPFVKASADVDVLVDATQLRVVADILRKAGFFPVEPAAASNADLPAWHRRHKESSWRRDSDRVAVDLHTRVADAPEVMEFAPSSPRQSVTVVSGLALPTLANAELLAYLAVHGASSCWFRLKWIADLAALRSRTTPAELEQAITIARRCGAARPMQQALALEQRLFGTTPPGGPHSRGDGLTALPLRALCAGEPTERPLGTVPIHLNQVLMREGLSDRVGDVGRQVLSAWSNRRART